MASMNKDEFIAMVEGMTVLELHEIVKALEDRFGVTAAAPVAAAAAPGAAAAVVEEKTEFDVILTGFGANKIQVIKVVRELWSASIATCPVSNIRYQGTACITRFAAREEIWLVPS